MSTQLYEIEAWLGDDHGLTDDQVDQLVTISDDIEDRYPDPDDSDERTAAFTAAYRVLSGDEQVIEELGAERTAARLAEVRALAGLQQAALMLIPEREESESGFQRRAGVDRMTVRKWLGKR